MLAHPPQDLPSFSSTMTAEEQLRALYEEQLRVQRSTQTQGRPFNSLYGKTVFAPVEMQTRLQPTEAPAKPVTMCLLPECDEPATSEMGLCPKHQSNFDSWQR